MVRSLGGNWHPGTGCNDRCAAGGSTIDGRRCELASTWRRWRPLGAFSSCKFIAICVSRKNNVKIGHMSKEMRGHK